MRSLQLSLALRLEHIHDLASIGRLAPGGGPVLATSSQQRSLVYLGAMQKMSKEEARSFLSHGTRTGKLAVVRKSGQPQVTPIWFVLDGDDVVFMTHETSGKGRALRRDSRVAMVVDEEVAPYAYVMVEGTATYSEEPDELVRWGTTIAGRYMGAHRAEEYGKRNGVPGEYLVRIHPTRIVAVTGIAD